MLAPRDYLTLQDVFTIVPALLQACVCIWIPQGAAIRALRLVSKDLARTALSAVKSCASQIGEGALPGSSDIARLFSTAKLQSMDVIVLVKAGK